MDVKIKVIQDLLIQAQNDLLRMSANAEVQQQAAAIIDDEYQAGFYGGCVKGQKYACKHITNILEKIENF